MPEFKHRLRVFLVIWLTAAAAGVHAQVVNFASTVVEVQEVTILEADEHGYAVSTEVAVAELSVVADQSVGSDLLVRYTVGADDVPRTDVGDGDRNNGVADAADYTDLGGGMVTIPRGETSAVIAIRIDDDDDIEPLRERFTLSLVDEVGYTLGSSHTATVVIREGVCDVTRWVMNSYMDEYREELGQMGIPVNQQNQTDCSDFPGGVTFESRNYLRLGELEELKELDFWFLHFVNPISPDSRFNLDLTNNSLIKLPERVFRGFDNLSNLRQLFLTNNNLTTLPAGIFKELHELQRLALDGNDLTRASFPDGIFSDLDSLELIWLARNPGPDDAAITFTPEFERVDEPDGSTSAEVRLIFPPAAPVELNLELEIQDAVVVGGDGATLTRVTIPQTSTRSEVFTVIQPGLRRAVVKTLSPRLLPANNYTGFEVGESEEFVVDETPVIVEGAELSTPANGSVFESGEFIRLTVRFSKDVVSTRSLSVPLEVGSTQKVMVYDAAASSPDALVFSYRVLPGDRDDDGFGVSAQVLLDRVISLIRDLSGRRAVGEFPGDLSSSATVNGGAKLIMRVAAGFTDHVPLESSVVKIQIEADRSILGDYTVAYRIGADDDLDTADAAADDYTDPGGGMVTVEAGRTTAVIALTIVDDENIDSPREVFFVSLEGPTPVYEFAMNSPSSARVTIREGVCDRTRQIAETIVGALPDVAACFDVDETLLAGIRELDSSRRGISNLKEDDFAGLTGLESLSIAQNGDLLRVSLPVGLFASLTNLTSLDMSSCRVGPLPRNIFASQSQLEILNLDFNFLRDVDFLLPGNLRRLTRLDLSRIGLSVLPAGAFKGLHDLETLELEQNSLTSASFPDGIFSDLDGLETLRLDHNPESHGVIRWTPGFERVDEPDNSTSAEVRLIFAPGAPFEMNFDLSLERAVVVGEDGEATSRVTIPKTSTHSGVFTVIQPGLRRAVVKTRRLGLNTAKYSGLEITESGEFVLDEAPLEVESAEFSAPADGSVFQGGEFIRLTVRFTKDVVSTRPLSVPLEVGSTQKVLVYDAAASSSDVWVFAYQVLPGDRDDDGIGISSQALFDRVISLVTDSEGNRVTGEFPGDLSSPATVDGGGKLMVRVAAGFTDHAPLESSVVEIQITADRQFQTDYTVAYRIGSDDDPGSADADADDYEDPGGGVITVEAGETTATLVLAINDDEDVEAPREVFVVSLSGGSPVYDLAMSSSSMATVVIREGVCDRTPQIRQVIVDASSETNACFDVGKGFLESITTLDVSSSRITALKEADFSGLTGLETLDLSDNPLTAPLPAGLFAHLAGLTSLDLNLSRMSTLSANVFAPLGALRSLNLSTNRLSVLPENVFASLSALQRLDLRNNRLGRDEGLPDGVFEGLRLTSLRLDGNWEDSSTRVFDFDLNLLLSETEEGHELALGMREGAPFDVTVTLLFSPPGILLENDRTAVTLSQGRTASTPIALINVPAGDEVSIGFDGDLPELPPDQCDGEPCYSGFRFRAGEDVADRVLIAPAGVMMRVRVFLEGALE